MAKNKRENLIVKYDSASDSLLLIAKKGKEESFEEIAPGVSVEFDKKGNVLGFEILKASSHLKRSLPGLAKKAKEFALAR
ncbi:MAG: DUF2283 domain-containing protein [Candidatus Liptonbacteria bacterium]|nr:DUF2283 domain-containing protein [Candidatus Liptonbacteria bacterium]